MKELKGLLIWGSRRVCDLAPVTFWSCCVQLCSPGALEEGMGLVPNPQLHIVAKQSGQCSVGRIWTAWCTFSQHMADLQ